MGVYLPPFRASLKYHMLNPLTNYLVHFPSQRSHDALEAITHERYLHRRAAKHVMLQPRSRAVSPAPPMLYSFKLLRWRMTVLGRGQLDGEQRQWKPAMIGLTSQLRGQPGRYRKPKHHAMLMLSTREPESSTKLLDALYLPAFLTCAALTCASLLLLVPE